MAPEWFEDSVDFVRKMDLREGLQQFLMVALVLGSALIMWKSLMLIAGTESPIVVVLSGSMKPGFDKGDLVFLMMDDEPIMPGQIVVFKVKNRDIPIIHRALEVHYSQNGTIKLLTKGDNNDGNDRFVYDRAGKVLYLEEKDVIGKAWGFLPYVGIGTIWLTETPILKILLIFSLALITFLSYRD